MATEPFRFLHTTGLLIDQPLADVGRIPQPQRQIVQSATLLAASQLVAIAIRQRVHAVLISGGLFPRGDVSVRGPSRLAKEFAKLDDAGIPVVIAAGVDDPFDRWLLGVRWPENVHLLSIESPYADLTTEDNHPVRVVGLSPRLFLHPHRPSLMDALRPSLQDLPAAADVIALMPAMVESPDITENQSKNGTNDQRWEPLSNVDARRDSRPVADAGHAAPFDTYANLPIFTARELFSCNVAYWGLGGRWSPATVRNSRQMIHDPGVPQWIEGRLPDSARNSVSTGLAGDRSSDHGGGSSVSIISMLPSGAIDVEQRGHLDEDVTPTTHDRALRADANSDLNDDFDDAFSFNEERSIDDELHDTGDGEYSDSDIAEYALDDGDNAAERSRSPDDTRAPHTGVNSDRFGVATVSTGPVRWHPLAYRFPESLRSLLSENLVAAETRVLDELLADVATIPQRDCDQLWLLQVTFLAIDDAFDRLLQKLLADEFRDELNRRLAAAGQSRRLLITCTSLRSRRAIPQPHFAMLADAASSDETSAAVETAANGNAQAIDFAHSTTQRLSQPHAWFSECLISASPEGNSLVARLAEFADSVDSSDVIEQVHAAGHRWFNAAEASAE